MLTEVSFVARPGQTIALVGPTGSGKSTLVALLSRLYDPTSGEVLVDGVPLTEVDPADLRRRMGVVPQDSFLFSESIQRNIGLGLPELEVIREEAVEAEVIAEQAAEVEGIPEPAVEADPYEAVVAAARIAQLHDQIEEFPKQYHTPLGERGINLSGGQKQRAALARALARDPVILVLDDALSAVDTHTEARILEDLRSVMRGRTSFIISHRVSAVMNADLILVLEDGRIVERGTHPELITADGTYARLLRRQMLEETLDEVGAAGD